MKLMSWVANCMRKVCRFWEEDNGAEGNGVAPSVVAVAALEVLHVWEKMMVAFCLSSTIAIATVSVQIQKILPRGFQWLSLALLLCFGCVAFGKMTKPIFPIVSQILYYLGGFLGVTALFIATAVPYAPHFQIIIFLIYIIFCLIFMFIAQMAPSSSPA